MNMKDKCEVIIKAILATIQYKSKVISKGKYDITNDCKIQYL